MAVIEEETERAVAEIEALEDEAERIDGLIDSISGIAEQTNMLALNANIEASRSTQGGEGGFTAVADEIQNLSEVYDSVKDVEERLEGLRTRALSAADEVRRSRERIEGVSTTSRTPPRHSSGSLTSPNARTRESRRFRRRPNSRRRRPRKSSRWSRGGGDERRDRPVGTASGPAGVRTGRCALPRRPQCDRPRRPVRAAKSPPRAIRYRTRLRSTRGESRRRRRSGGGLDGRADARNDPSRVGRATVSPRRGWTADPCVPVTGRRFVGRRETPLWLLETVKQLLVKSTVDGVPDRQIRRFGSRVFELGTHGCAGDSVTVLPLLVALAATTSVSLPTSWSGSESSRSYGVYYGMPLSIEPMKALVGLAIVGSLSYPELAAAGLLAGAVLLAIGSFGLVGHLQRVVGEPVVRASSSRSPCCCSRRRLDSPRVTFPSRWPDSPSSVSSPSLAIEA